MASWLTELLAPRHREREKGEYLLPRPMWFVQEDAGERLMREAHQHEVESDKSLINDYRQALIKNQPEHASLEQSIRERHLLSDRAIQREKTYAGRKQAALQRKRFGFRTSPDEYAYQARGGV